MDDRLTPEVKRWSVVRLCESSRHQKQLLAQAYRQVFPQIRQPLVSVNPGVTRCGNGTAPQADGLDR